jgi:hypothetical protein
MLAWDDGRGVDIERRAEDVAKRRLTFEEHNGASAVEAAPLALGPFFPLFLPVPPTKWGLLFLSLARHKVVGSSLHLPDFLSQ